jgi:hypothetical protein
MAMDPALRRSAVVVFQEFDGREFDFDKFRWRERT